MGLHVVKLPDVGEGIAEAELVEWHVAVGDHVVADTQLADVLTDKATVEVSSPVSGVVTFLAGNPGDVLAIGSDLVGIEVEGSGNAAGQRRAASPPAVSTAAPEVPDPASVSAQTSEVDLCADTESEAEDPPAESARQLTSGRPVAAPAVRLRAKDLGVDLRLVRGSGPAGRITHGDLDGYAESGSGAPKRRPRHADTSVTETQIVGLRRKIAEKMSLSASRIPHITYVDEIDLTSLEALRAALNTEQDRSKLTLLPFVIRAVVAAVAGQPHLNSTFDDERGVLLTSAGVHVGIATQTANGLIVPVVRHAEQLGLRECAAEISRVSDAARDGSATRDELSESTITISSLGALGGLVTTPIINHPEVAIIGINKMQMRPVWEHGSFLPRMMMNLSSSFDHRVVDGWDAANFLQAMKALIENPLRLLS